MQNSILSFLVNVLKERGGALLGLVRKGLNALRSLLGGSTAFLRALLKKAVSFVMSKLAPSAAGAHEKERSSLESLRRRVQDVMAGKASPEASEVEEPAAEVELPTDAPAVVAERTVAERREAPPVVTGETSAAGQVESADAPPAEPPASESSGRGGHCGIAPGSASLVDTAPRLPPMPPDPPPVQSGHPTVPPIPP